MILQRVGLSLNGLGCFYPILVPFWQGFKNIIQAQPAALSFFLKALYIWA